MPRLLKSLRVGNFKAFADTQSILIKPITLIFGPNSAGKSSFIHSLALAHEAQFGREKRSLSRLDVHHTDVGGSSIDLGGFRQYVHRGQLNKRVEWGAELEVSALLGSKSQRLAQLLESVKTISLSIELGIELDNYDRPKSGALPQVEAVEIMADGEELLRMSRRAASVKADGHAGYLRLDRLASEHVVFRQVLKAVVEAQTTSESITPEDLEAADEVINELLPQLVVNINHFFPSNVELPNAESDGMSPASRLFAISKGNRKEDLAQAIRFVLPRTLNDLVKGLGNAISDELKQLQYLGPLRSFPPRHLAFAEHEDTNWYAGGGYAWDQVRRDDATREAVNAWLGSPNLLKTPYKLVSRRLVPENQVLINLVESIVESAESEKLSAAPSELVSNLLAQLEEAESRNYEIEDESNIIASHKFRIDIDQKDASRSLLISEINKIEAHLSELNSKKNNNEIQLKEIRATITKDASLALKRTLMRFISRDNHISDEIITFNERLKELKLKLNENETELSKLVAIVDLHHMAAERSTYEKKRKGLAIEKLKQLLYSYQREIPEDFDQLEALAGTNFSSSGSGKKYIAQMFKEHIDEQFPDALQELKLVDVSKNVEVTHRDVGIGISQVLPVLVMAYGSRGKLLAMEQPEIHLHPALQAELGDVFIESALGERQNTFILETHSEHLILRLMRRIREGKLSPDDISVVFVEPLSRGSRFVELRIDEEGDFIDEWPGGFFEESFHEKFGGR